MKNNLINLHKHVTELIKQNNLKDAKSKLEYFFSNIEKHKQNGGHKEQAYIDKEIKHLKILYGDILYKLELFGTGVKFLQTLEPIAEYITNNNESKEFLTAIKIYLNIAYGFLELKDIDKCFIYSKKAFNICKNSFYPEQLLASMDFMIIKLLKDKQYKKVESYYNQMEIVYNNIDISNDNEMIKRFKYLLESKRADLLIMQKNYDKALFTLKAVSSKIAHDEKSKHSLANIVSKSIIESFILLAQSIGYSTPYEIQKFIQGNGIFFEFE